MSASDNATIGLDPLVTVSNNQSEIQTGHFVDDRRDATAFFAHYRSLLLQSQLRAANLVTSPQSEMPGGWSQFDALLAAASSPSTNQGDAASRLAHPSQGRAWKCTAEAPTKSDVTTNNSLIKFLAASSCLVTGEL